MPEDDGESSGPVSSRIDSKALQRDVARVGQPKVLDFGLARITDADVKTATIQTEVGHILGTLRYMSPEQVEGVSGAIDTRSDIYALGVIAFELLSGQVPHDVEGQTVYEVIRLIRSEDPRRLSSIDRSLHGDVETIVSKALEKERERRYATAGGNGGRHPPIPKRRADRRAAAEHALPDPEVRGAEPRARRRRRGDVPRPRRGDRGDDAAVDLGDAGA